MNKSLFKPNNHSDLSCLNLAEQHYSYLNRSGRNNCFKIRETLDKWFNNYPNKHKYDLKSHFQSDDNTKFISSFFELYLHELFYRMEYKIVVHPEIKNTKKKPDFLLITPDGAKVYVEATTATKKLEEGKNHRKFLDRIYDKIETIKNPHFDLYTEEVGFLEKQPSEGKIKKEVKSWLELLNWKDKKEKSMECIVDDKFRIKFFVFPKTNNKSSEYVEIISHMAGFQKVFYSKPIRKAIKKKGGRYENLNGAYIIAVNCIGSSLERDYIIEALFGSELYQIDLNLEDQIFKSKAIRKSDGIWHFENKANHTRVSGVLIGDKISPWTLENSNMELFCNPWAKYPLNSSLKEFTRLLFEKNKIIEKKGIHPKDILNIPKDWISK